MNTYEFNCIPNGRFNFDELLELAPIKKAIVEIKRTPGSVNVKLKVLLSYMQYLDLIAEISYQRQEDMGLDDPSQFDAMESAGKHVMNNFDEVMKNFTEQQREFLRKAVR